VIVFPCVFLLIFRYPEHKGFACHCAGDEGFNYEQGRLRDDTILDTPITAYGYYLLSDHIL